MALWLWAVVLAALVGLAWKFVLDSIDSEFRISWTEGAIGLAVIALVLAMNGRTKLRAVHPKPERTVDTLKQVPDALKGQ